MVTTTTIEDTLNKQLAGFSSHGLQDLDRATLMNRVDTKFIVRIEDLPTLFDSLGSDYSVLEIDNKRMFRYQSTYFDTDNFLLYHMHHNRRLNRHKVRLRHYVDSDTHYLEVKFKNNKKRTIKSRIQVDGSQLLDLSAHQEFLHQTGLPTHAYLSPRLISQYKRVAFASEAREERLTIDFDLSKHGISLPTKRSLALRGLVIAELKQKRFNRHSPFFQRARQINLRATGFSKYCMGVALTMPDHQDIKQNRFKRITQRVLPSTFE